MARVKFKALDPEMQDIYSLVGTLSKGVDWQCYGLQTITAKKRGISMHVRHDKQAILIEFEGFGDLFGQPVALFRDDHSISQSFIGINNDVTLAYSGCLPSKGVRIAFIPIEYSAE